MNYKNKWLSFALAGGLILSSGQAVYAAGDSEPKDIEQTEVVSAVDPGTTPDDWFYFLDQLFEAVEMTFTFDDEDDRALLVEQSKERLAEFMALEKDYQSGELTTEEWQDAAKNIMKEYISTLKSAVKNLEVLKIEIEDKEAFEAMLENIKGAIEVPEDILKNEDGETEENAALDKEADVEKELEEIKKTVTVVNDFNPEQVSKLRKQGFGYGEIKHLLTLASAADKNVAMIVEMREAKGMGFGKMAKELGLHPGVLGGKKMTEETPVTEDSAEKGEQTKQTDTDELAEVVEAKNSDKTIVESNSVVNVQAKGTDDIVEADTKKPKHANKKVKAKEVKHKGHKTNPGKHKGHKDNPGKKKGHEKHKHS